MACIFYDKPCVFLHVGKTYKYDGKSYSKHRTIHYIYACLFHTQPFGRTQHPGLTNKSPANTFQNPTLFNKIAVRHQPYVGLQNIIVKERLIS